MAEAHINPDQNLTGKIEVGIVYPELEELQVTPTTERQLIYPEHYGFSEVEVGAVTSAIDSDIKAENIKKDVDILGVVGTMESVNAQEKTATPSTSQQIITPDSNYNSLSKVTIEGVTKDIDANIVANNIRVGVTILGVTGNVEEVNAQTKNVTPTTSEQTIEPDANYNALDKVVVGAVTSAIDSNIQSSNIKAGVSILGVQGNVEPDKPDQVKTANPSTSSQTITPDIGYELASVTINPVTSSIDSNIVASNIKKDVTILGVTGTMEQGEDLSTELNAQDEIISTQATKISQLEALIENKSLLELQSATSDATATASDIALNKTAYVNGNKITGTMPVSNYNALINITGETITGSAKANKPIYSIVELPFFDATNLSPNDFNEFCSNYYSLIKFPQVNAEGKRQFAKMFYNCRSLRDVPVLDTSSLTSWTNAFYNCENLTNESLNNILQMCINSTNYTGTKTLSTLGLNTTQKEICETLSNWTEFVNAGWTA